MTVALPVEAVLEDVMTALRATGVCVLVAPTGAGKTTRLPGALVDAGMGPVVVLEPRRLAARAAARRVAQERGSSLGDEVGYHVRFDRRSGPRTAITFVTDGVFLRRLQDDPFLEGIGSVVLDEFHERSLNVDLALAMVRRVQLDVRGDLKLVVTSATLDAELLSEYLDDAPIVRSRGRLFPVQVEHLPPRPQERQTEHVTRAIREALDLSEGHILTFLPGVGEIRRVGKALQDLARTRRVELLELYGDLDPRAQDAILNPSAQRKLILSTNVAESSVTVPGVRVVVDTGLARSLRYDPAVGLDRLELGRISLASAQQRAGRAGREAPGHCLRLWSKAEQRTLRAFEDPEVKRADLTATLLQLLAWGERDLESFGWLEPPPRSALEAAWSLARSLGAVEGNALTPIGAQLARIPAQPRLARLLISGREGGVPNRAALAAAVLGERDPRRRDATVHATESDVLERVRSLEAFAQGGPGAAGDLLPQSARNCLRSAEQLLRILGRGETAALGAPSPPCRDPEAADEALLRSLLDAFPDRLVRRRREDPARGVLVGGRGVRLSERSGLHGGELYLALDLDAGRGEARVHMASLVEREWVNGGETTCVLDCVFDPERRRVQGRKRVLLGQLVLEQHDAPAGDTGEIERVLVQAAREDLTRALDLNRAPVQSLLLRLECLSQWMPELELPTFGTQALEQLLPELARGCRSFRDLAQAPLVETILAHLTPPQESALKREAPERLQVPSGSRIQLTYASGRPPVLAARIQELFGLRQTPRIAGGRVPVLLHLLAPNGRPEQITEDLESFWSKTYFDVRRELRRRYPKHDWPEDPTTATPSRRPQRKRRPR